MVILNTFPTFQGVSPKISQMSDTFGDMSVNYVVALLLPSFGMGSTLDVKYDLIYDPYSFRSSNTCVKNMCWHALAYLNGFVQKRNKKITFSYGSA